MYNIIMDIHFTWDEEKNRSNQKKHGISFEEAATVFHDDDALLKYDEAHSLDEERFVMLGMSKANRMLVVCHCCRTGGVLHLISARKATRREESQYWERL